MYSQPGRADIYQEAPGGEAFARQVLGAFQKADYSILQKLQPGPKELFSWSPISGNEILEAFMPRMGPKQRAKAQAEIEQMNKERFARHDKAWAKASQDTNITGHYAGLIAKRTTEQQQAFAKVIKEAWDTYQLDWSQTSFYLHAFEGTAVDRTLMIVFKDKANFYFIEIGDCLYYRGRWYSMGLPELEKPKSQPTQEIPPLSPKKMVTVIEDWFKIRASTSTCAAEAPHGFQQALTNAKVDAKHFEMYRKREKRWVEKHIEHFRRLYCPK